MRRASGPAEVSPASPRAAPPRPQPARPAPARHAAEAPDRLVFFFSGFDPKGSSFYHRLFRDGAARRNASHPDSLVVGPRHAVGRWAAAWTVFWRGDPRAGPGGPRPMRTRVHFMRWDDLVRAQWTRSPLQLARDYWNVYARGIASGVFTRVRRQAPAAFGLALFPLAVAASSLAGGLVLVGGLLRLTGALGTGAALAAGLAAGVLAWRLVARRLDCEWLLRLYAFTRLQALGALPAVQARQTDLAARLVDAVTARIHQPGSPPLREVLVVGYSTGSTLAASVLARALPRLREVLDGRGGSAGTTLGLLTLGHCIPVATEWRGAERLRAELADLAACEALVWHDYSAPADWAAFSRTPPWPQPARLRGLQASPRFHAQLGAGEYAALRRDRREMHLQYLRPPERPVPAHGFDFFLLAAGPDTLAQRHADQAGAAAARP